MLPRMSYKLLLLSVIGLLIGVYAFSQSVEFSDSIRWNNPIFSVNNENKPQIILSFSNSGQKNEHFLPVYYKKIRTQSEIVVKNPQIVNAVYEVLPDSVLNFLTDVDKINEEINIEVFTSCFRKEYAVSFEFVPLRRNKSTGRIEKLVSFTLQSTAVVKSEFRNTRSYASSSKLSSGKWYKIKLDAPGIYKLTYEQLTQMGFSNFSTLGVFGFGKMLPKKNNEVRYDDLPERDMMKVDANANSVFDAGDYILFYADGPDRIYYDNSSQSFKHEKHDYSEYAYYFISDRGTWKSPQVINSEATFNAVVNSYNEVKFLEKDSLNVRGMGRTWFWRHFDFYTSYQFTQNFPNLITSEPLDIDIYLAARSSLSSNFKIYIANTLVNTTLIGYVSGNYSSTYAKEEIASISHLAAGPDISYRIDYIKSTSDSEGWLNYIRASGRCSLTMSSDFLIFRDINSVDPGSIAQFVLGNTNANTVVWDITDPVNAVQINPVLAGTQTKFNRNSETLHEYIAFNPSGSFQSPVTEGDGLGLIANQNLHALANPDLIIVTYPGFRAQAQQLADLHTLNDGMSCIVVDPAIIYNEFSSGCPDVSAIRDFVKMFYDRAGSDDEIPENLLLFGDGSFDNKAPSGVNGNFVPTYQTTNSFSPSGAFVSDDFYVMLDPNEGTVNGYDDSDIGIGRIPAKSVSEAQTVVNKIIAYISSAYKGSWRNTVTFVGDDAEDYDIHQIHCNEIADIVRANYPVYNVDKIFLDSYEQVSTVQGMRYPEVNEAIDNRIQKGTLIFNYTGHGNTKTLAHEVVVDLSQINSWVNNNNYAIFFTATCEFSRFDDFELVSAGEQVLLNPHGGGIALFTTSRLVQAGANTSLNKAFYNYFFVKDADLKPYTMGQIIIRTKNELNSDTNKRNFVLLGDPAMCPALPQYNVVTTSINGINVSSFADTVGARSKVIVTGYIQDEDGNKMSGFNGLLFPVVYDKNMEFQTRGNDGKPPLEFSEQMNILFKGQTSVVNGEFTFSFIVPVDIAYFYGNGKISYYAHDNNVDAHGNYSEIMIGGSSDSNIADNEGPEIELYMNNEDFIIGGITDENPNLLAFVSDSSGINTVGSGIGHDILAVLDENTSHSIVLNEYYESNLDDYTSGKILYPFSNLELGPHTLSLKVWDVLNNSSVAYTDFMVASSSELVIDHVFNYPNPFSTNTQFYFEHNQPNVPMDVLIQVFTVAGKLVKTIEVVVVSDGFRSQPISWNALDDYGDKIGKGVYIYKISVKAPNGNIARQIEKLFIIN
ncbi:MAG: type IX secretion system sortase PorU [Bacteroidales bacterium]|nr:type IX secretion system sortase PorU [Bacteroidales bacterium]